MRIVQVANFVSPTSGGLRTTLRHLAEGYAGQGHEVVQVLPGERDAETGTPWGCQVSLRSATLPGTGYRLLVEPARVRAALARLAPDRLEVHDRTTLRGLGRWAQRSGVPSLVVSHERTDRWLEQWLSSRLPLQAWADRANAGLARDFDRVVCTTAWAAEEFHRLAVPHLVTIPLGVDHLQFAPRLRARRAPGAPVQLVMVCRLSKEKRPDLAVEAVRELCRRGVDVHLVVAGDGPMQRGLAELGRALPIRWCGFMSDRAELAGLLSDADIALAPGPVETFGLAALEALACGTPVVVNFHSALPEVVGPDAGRAAASSGFVFADAVQELLDLPEAGRRAAARARAEQFSWSSTVEGFLAVHRQRRRVPA